MEKFVKDISFAEDPRLPCKYGKECYQKNTSHLQKYKHPTAFKRESNDSNNADAKKTKLCNTTVGTQKETKLTNWLTKNTPESDLPARNTPDHEISESSDSESESNGNNGKVHAAGSTTAPSSDNRHHISESSDSESTDVQQANKNKDVNDQSKEKQKLTESPDVSLEQQENTTRETNDFPSILISDSTPRDIINKTLKEMFLVDMPEDFFSFWSYCISLNKTNPSDALKACGLQLVGPFDVLAGKFNNHKLKNRSLYLNHWRYYYDPPEFQTVLRGDDTTQYHIGYFRDDPKESPCFLASNNASKDGVITPLGENIFGAVNTYMDSSMKTSNPFLKLKIASTQKTLQSWAKANDFTLDALTPNMKRRKSKVVSKTFHMAGIVVPVQPKTDLGYRELIETNSKLKRILKFIVEADSDVGRDLQMENLQPIITAANIANDECDFGTSLELGIDLFSFGGVALQRSALQLLTTAYSLLRRPEFAKIIEAHLQFRQKGTNLSILSFK